MKQDYGIATWIVLGLYYYFELLVRKGVILECLKR